MTAAADATLQASSLVDLMVALHVVLEAGIVQHAQGLEIATNGHALGDRVHFRHERLPMLPMWYSCLLYTSPSPRDGLLSRMPSSA